MNRPIITICLAVISLFSIAQDIEDDYILETKYRNPIDTAKISNGESPYLLLFVHNAHGECNCATRNIHKALSRDSLGLRAKNNIKLYVVYPRYSEKNIQEFESFNGRNVVLAFDFQGKYRRSFLREGNTTPFIVLFDGKGNKWTHLGGSFEKVKGFIENSLSK